MRARSIGFVKSEARNYAEQTKESRLELRQTVEILKEDAAKQEKESASDWMLPSLRPLKIRETVCGTVFPISFGANAKYRSLPVAATWHQTLIGAEILSELRSGPEPALRASRLRGYSQRKQESHGGLPHHQTPFDPHVLRYEPSKALVSHEM